MTNTTRTAISTRIPAKAVSLFLFGLFMNMYIPIFVDVLEKYRKGKIDYLDFGAIILWGLLLLFTLKALQSFFIQKIEFDFEQKKIILHKTFNNLVVHKNDVQEWGVRNIGTYPGQVLNNKLSTFLHE